MTKLEAVYEELKNLPAPKLEEAASYVHKLKEDSQSERRSALEALAGTWNEQESKEMEDAMWECRKLEPSEW
jgi:hypothetical protein